MTFHRREVLGAFGVASASTLLWALGCGAPRPALRRAPQVSRDVRSWLQDAVARLSTIYPSVHALAVSRRRTTAALDVLGPGIARLRADGAVLTIRLSDGSSREHVTSELTADGIAAAVQALGAPRERAAIEFGAAPRSPAEPPLIDDGDLRHRVELLQADARPSSRIVYAAALIDIDDAIVWSVAPGRDLEQRLVRIRQAVTRAAWNGTRPVVADLHHAWSGWLDDQPLTPGDLAAASDAALKLMTPGAFHDGERTVVLDPSVVAIVLDTLVRGRLTATAPWPGRGAIAADLAGLSLAAGTGQPGNPRTAGAAQPLDNPRAATAPLASALITLVDDPTLAGAYGGFAFDDEGEPAAPLTLLDAGRITARLADRARGGAGRGRRPGHLGCVEPSSSHLQLVPGTTDAAQLYTDGLVLEAGLGASFDPASDRIRIACARARELKAGNATGRVYPDVELVGSLTALLTAADAVARVPASFAMRDDDDREPRWRSISTPAVRTRGLVRSRRTHA